VYTVGGEHSPAPRHVALRTRTALSASLVRRTTMFAFATTSTATPVAKRSQFAGASVRSRAVSMPTVQRRGDLCVRAARVAGVEIPNNKRCETALTYVYGIGPTSAKAIMSATGLENKRLREFSEEELTQLREEVEKYQIEGELRRSITMNIKRLKEIQCHRGKMHIRNLPVRGQRTKTNARTRKGKVKTVAGKKK
jgi:small subunit ribosomal protein S13